ncbi:MAG TPA: hypothetical protein VMW53_07520 [archaeon]|nr:hypothetical protein [archaeon]
MSYDLETAVTNLQTMILTIASGIKAAPVGPPEKINQFPFSLVYIKEFTTLGGTYHCDEIIDTIAIEIHYTRQNLPTAYIAALACRVEILEKLIADPTLGGAVDTFTDLRGVFGYLPYGAETHIGWQMELDVKGKITI